MRSKRALLLRSISKFLSILVRRKRKREMEKSFDLTGTKILDYSTFRFSSRDENSEDSFIFSKGGRGGGKINDRGDTLAVEMLLGQMENFIAVCSRFEEI